MTDRTPTSDPVAEPQTEAGRHLLSYHDELHGDDPALDMNARILAIEAEARQQARAAFAAQVRAAVEAKKLRGADFTTRWGHGFDDAIRSVLFTLDALLAASPEPEAPEASGSGLREADPDKMMCGQCGDWLHIDDIVGHLASEGRALDAREYDRLAARPDGAEANVG